MRNILFIAMLLLALMSPGSFSHGDTNTEEGCVAKACTSANGVKLLAPFSITGRTIACAKETLDIIFGQSSTCKSVMLSGLKNYVKGGVYAALTLAVILLGIKIVLSGEPPKTGELFSFILKFGVVLYMCLGTGLTEFVYKGGTALITGLPNYLMSHSTGEFCNYSPDDYEDHKYAYLLAWDILDCRISHYLVIGLASIAPPLATLLPFGALQMIIPLVFSLQIVVGLLVFVFMIFILSLAANFLHMMVLAMLSLGILTYAGFIFVPMMLFSYTESYFKSWWQGIVSCALQPLVISAFMSITFLAFDNIMYSGCKFQKVVKKNGDKEIHAYLMIPGSATEEEECKKRLGYQMFELATSDLTSTQVGLLFKYATFQINFKQMGEALQALIQALLFCYLFMLIAKKGGDFASKITSGPNIGKSAIGAGAVIDAALEKISGKKSENDKDKDSGSKGSKSSDSGSKASTSKGSGSSASKGAKK